MREHNDILLSPDFDLLDYDGDLVTGDCLIQQQAVLLTVGEGEIKQSPVTGVYAESFLNDEDEKDFFRKTRSQFRADSLLITGITKNEGKILISASHA